MENNENVNSANDSQKGYCNHRVNTELSLDLKTDSVFWVSNGDIGIVFY